MRRLAALLIVTLQLTMLGCNGQRTHSNSRYQKYKSEFPPSLTAHFPDCLASFPVKVVNNQDISKNDVGLLLYEYKVEKKNLDSIVTELRGKAIAEYSSRDSCLLIVNQFETIDSFESDADVEIIDSASINRACFESLFPMPNFVHYKYRIDDRPLKLDDSFIIYILEAKSGKHFNVFDLQPSLQMPKPWENGYSKGIAISYEYNTVIYWGIVW